MVLYSNQSKTQIRRRRRRRRRDNGKKINVTIQYQASINFVIKHLSSYDAQNVWLEVGHLKMCVFSETYIQVEFLLMSCNPASNTLILLLFGLFYLPNLNTRGRHQLTSDSHKWRKSCRLPCAGLFLVISFRGQDRKMGQVICCEKTSHSK